MYNFIEIVIQRFLRFRYSSKAQEYLIPWTWVKRDWHGRVKMIVIGRWDGVDSRSSHQLH